MPEEAIKFPSIKDVPASAWEKLSQKKIYFGHQSVGFNIIDGIKDLMKKNPQIRLNIVETNNPADFKVKLFVHSMVGKNHDPESKISDFEKLMEKGVGSAADIAFFKFCFVDIGAETNVINLFTKYKNSLGQLKRKYPETTFIHVTVPLRTSKTSFKTLIKKILGKKDIWEYDRNINKNEFNQLLRKEYEGKETVFDLAMIESTYSDGRMSTFKKEGQIYYSLVPDYSNDGGHLNDAGSKKVAEQLLILLANLS